MLYPNIKIKPRKVNEAVLNEMNPKAYRIKANVEFVCEADLPSDMAFGWAERRLEQVIKEGFSECHYADVSVTSAKQTIRVAFGPNYDPDRGAMRGKWKKYR